MARLRIPAEYPQAKISGSTVQDVVAPLDVAAAPMPCRATPLIASNRPPMYSCDPSG